MAETDGTHGDGPVAAAGRNTGPVWTRPLRVLLSLFMIVLLVSVSSVLIGLDYQRARSAAIEDATERMRVFSDRVVDRFRVLFGNTTALVGLASISDIFARPPPDRLGEKIAFLRQAVMRSPHIDGAFAGYTDGSFIHLVDLRGSTGWRKALGAPAGASVTAVRSIEISPDGTPLSRWTFLDANGTMVKEHPRIAANYDPRSRLWYQAATGGSLPISTQPYRGATTGALAITVAQAHRANRRVVIGVDVLLETITSFLAEERISPGAIAFLVNQAGAPIIHSDGETSAFGALRLADAIESAKLPETTARSLEVGGRTYVVRASAVDLESLLEGNRIVVAAPLDELTAEARRGMRQGLVASAFILAVGIALALLVASWMTRALQNLTLGVDRLRHLDFDTPVEVRSHVAEISALGGAMDKGLEAIRTFGLYVPKELVRRIVDAGQFTGRSAQRQDVTAMFTDIYDFTTISERHSPEEVVGMLSVYFDIFSEAIGEHGGAIIQFLGDSVFAMWNAPIPDPRHAEHACACALALKGRLDEFNAAQRARGQPELRTRFGIHSGPALVGSVGAERRLQYTGMGDTLNVASRLEGMNKNYGTTILVSSVTVERCVERFTFRPLGSAYAKGRSAELEVHELVGNVFPSAPA
jgi:adenylate cyclase